ncbi:MAG: hypothetical protein C4302_07265 [Thermus sp.]
MRKGITLVLALFGLALAQTPPRSHTVTVNVPSVLSVSLDAADLDFLFDFSSNATDRVTVGGTPYSRAGQSAYNAFLDANTSSQVFAPSRVSLGNLGGGTGDFATLTVRSNRAKWTVSVSASGSLEPPLDNTRLQVYAEKISGAGSSLTTNPTPLPTTGSLNIIQATASGQGKSSFKVYNLLELRLSDDIPLSVSGYSSQITLTYTIGSP